MSYGLGTINDSLPRFARMTDPRGPIGTASIWSAGFMPVADQGALFHSQGSPLLDLAALAGINNRT